MKHQILPRSCEDTWLEMQRASVSILLVLSDFELVAPPSEFDWPQVRDKLASDMTRSSSPLPALGEAPTLFLTKTYQPVDNPALDDLISWNEGEMTSFVWRLALFVS
ncbi:hypothetical protein NL676_005648 [Syzygium grande]|nr:hypothetical protein NL676_005648 [Syzygium grande]